MPNPHHDRTPYRSPAGGFSRIPLGLWWFAIVLSIAILQFAYRYLALVAAGSHAAATRPFIDEFTAVFGAGLLFWPIRSLVRRLPLNDARWLRRGGLYLLALPVLSAIHTSLNWSSRAILYPLSGQGSFDYGAMPARYFMEFAIDLIAFVIVIVALHVAQSMKRAQQREVEAAQLHQNLTQARLESLRLQLQPHFLFNTLNTISSTMHRDVEAADQMIQRLGDLLRLTLKSGQQDEVPLAQELEALEDYLALMRARFADRLDVTVETTATANQVLVPSMLLQPLIENAIRHGALQKTGSARIRVSAKPVHEHLEIEVWDDGPGTKPGVNPLDSGLGLSATAERLQLLYGEEQRLAAGPGKHGGFSVHIAIPLTRNGQR